MMLMSIQYTILTLFYRDYFSKDIESDWNLDLALQKLGLPEKDLYTHLVTLYQLKLLTTTSEWVPGEEMIDGKLHKVTKCVNYYMISAQGIIAIETNQKGDVPCNLVNDNMRIRMAILDAAAENRHENGISNQTGHWETIQHAYFDKAVTRGIDIATLNRNDQILSMQGFLTRGSLCSGFEITNDGLIQHEIWQRKIKNSEEFEALKNGRNYTPQARGRRIEKVLSNSISSDNWKCDTNILSETEEQDLVISRNREYYLAECKWEKKAVGAPYISRLKSKVIKRPGCRGIFFSMSGFADTAIMEAIDQLNMCLIMFFGPSDIQSIIAEEMSFSSLLNQKYDVLIKSRKMLSDGIVLPRSMRNNRRSGKKVNCP